MRVIFASVCIGIFCRSLYHIEEEKMGTAGAKYREYTELTPAAEE
jgi:hypothetical protein